MPYNGCVNNCTRQNCVVPIQRIGQTIVWKLYRNSSLCGLNSLTYKSSITSIFTKSSISSISVMKITDSPPSVSSIKTKSFSHGGRFRRPHPLRDQRNMQKFTRTEDMMAVIPKNFSIYHKQFTILQKVLDPPPFQVTRGCSMSCILSYIFIL